MVLAIIFSASVSAAPSSAEIEEAYKKGQADWDKGDPISAMPKLKIAADGGHAVGQALLAYVLDQADNDIEAAEYYRKAAAQENHDGMFGLATFHLSGDGGVTKDVAAAKELFVRAGKGGHVQSINVMVMSYINGGLDLSDDERSGPGALFWYGKGVEAGLTPAYEKLIDANRNGKLGLALNKEEADRLQAKLYEILGIDPTTVKKKRQRK
jgi:TPR repeat protein